LLTLLHLCTQQAAAAAGAAAAAAVASNGSSATGANTLYMRQASPLLTGDSGHSILSTSGNSQGGLGVTLQVSYLCQLSVIYRCVGTVSYSALLTVSTVVDTLDSMRSMSTQHVLRTHTSLCISAYTSAILAASTDKGCTVYYVLVCMYVNLVYTRTAAVSNKLESYAQSTSW
jgi:hypothetical protein